MLDDKTKAQAELAYAIYTDFSPIINSIKNNLGQISNNNTNKPRINQIREKLEIASILLNQLKAFSELKD